MEQVVFAVFSMIPWTVCSNRPTENLSFNPGTSFNLGRERTISEISVRIARRISGTVNKNLFWASFKAQIRLQKALTANFSS